MTPRQRLESFFNQEVGSYLDATRMQDNEDVALKAVCQTVWWARALDEFHEKASGQVYKNLRDGDDSGKHMVGIRYARNRGGHQVAELIRITGGAYFPILLPAPFFEFVWRDLAELPAPDPRWPDVAGAKAYEDHLQAVPVRMTFQYLIDFFNRVP
jgi:hypothetical protein